MADHRDNLSNYYRRHRAEIDTAADSKLLFLLDYLQRYGPMTLSSLEANLGFGEETTAEIIATLLDRAMVEKEGTTLLQVAERGRQLLEEVLGNVHAGRKPLGTRFFALRLPNRGRSDLIVGMTLAEMFLLLLLLVWYGHATSSRQVRDLEAQLASFRLLGERLAQADLKIASLEGQLESCRSHRKCEENNVLIKASIVRGHISVQLLKSSKFSQWMRDSGHPEPALDHSITDRLQIETLLKNIGDYYRDERKGGMGCRFDYDMTYQTKEDYYDGRELFERYFYPATLNRVK
jgi:hypothetical protein